MASVEALHASRKIDTVDDGGSWAKLHMALDGVSYIIAFYLVDAFTFGPPQLRAASPSEREAAVTSGVSSPPYNVSSPIRRSASEGESVYPAVPKKHQPYHHSPLLRSKNHSDSQVDHLKYLYASQVSSSPSSSASATQDSQRISPSGAEKEGRYKEDYFTNRSLHHHQKKLFSRQVERTLKIQPLVRTVLVTTFLGFWFLAYTKFFGTPGFVFFLLHMLFRSSRNLLSRLEEVALWVWRPLFLTAAPSTVLAASS